MTQIHSKDMELFYIFNEQVEKKSASKKQMWSDSPLCVQQYINQKPTFQGDVTELSIAPFLTANTDTVFHNQKSFNNTKTQIDVVSENGLMISVKSSGLQKIGKSKKLNFANLELDKQRQERLLICFGVLPSMPYVKVWTLDLDYLRANKDNKTIPGLQVSTDIHGSKKYTLVITQERKMTRKDYDLTWLDKHEGAEQMIRTVKHHLNLLKTDI